MSSIIAYTKDLCCVFCYRASTFRIAEKYPTAVKNSKKILHSLLQQGLPGLDDTDKRNRWLYLSDRSFSTVFEAIEYLESLRL